MSSPNSQTARSLRSSRRNARRLSTTESDDQSRPHSARDQSPFHGFIETPTGSGAGTILDQSVRRIRQRFSTEQEPDPEQIESEITKIQRDLEWYRDEYQVHPGNTSDINNQFITIEKACTELVKVVTLNPQLQSHSRSYLMRLTVLKSELEVIRNQHWSRQSDITPITLCCRARSSDPRVFSGSGSLAQTPRDVTVIQRRPVSPPTATSSTNSNQGNASTHQDDALVAFLNSFEKC